MIQAMKIEKLQLQNNKININLKFYFFLKCLVKIKPNTSQVNKI